MKLFKNKNYTVLLIVGFICYFYQNAMNYYAPIGAMQVMGASTQCSRCTADASYTDYNHSSYYRRCMGRKEKLPMHGKQW